MRKGDVLKIVVGGIFFLLAFAFIRNAAFGAPSPSGIYYSIDLASEKVIPNHILEQYDFIDTKVVNNKLHYYVGAERNYLKAAHLCKKVQESGFENATVVAFFNFVLVPVEEALAFQNENLNYIDQALAPNSNGNDNMNYWKSLRYEVQLGTFTNTSNIEKIQRLDNVRTRSNKGMIYHTHGAYSNFKAAERNKQQLIDEGYEDAFLVAFVNGIQVPIEEAIIVEAFHKQNTRDGSLAATK